MVGQVTTRHAYSDVDVPVDGGLLRVGVWEPQETPTATLVLVHGVTSSHLVWRDLVDHLPRMRLIAPDLRGRGRANSVRGPSGMAQHADDLAAVMLHLGVDAAPIVGHSMGGFVGVVFAHRHTEMCEQLILIDGGLPLDVPAGLTPDEVVAGILGPTGQRLSMRFPHTKDYLDFWRQHPAFIGAWSPRLEAYFAYDLVDDGDALRPATSYATTAEDTVDLNTGTALTDALAHLSVRTSLLTVPRGLTGQEPGLYASDYLARTLEDYPSIAHERTDDFNHYTIALTDAGATRLAQFVTDHLIAGKEADE